MLQLTTNAVQVSFISPVPPPNVTALISESYVTTVSACLSGESSPPSLSGCVPGESVITIVGDYFYQPINVYIGGKLCEPAAGLYVVSPRQIVCVVPLLDYYVPGFYYDLVLNDTVYADNPEVGVLPSAIAFLPRPHPLQLRALH